MKISKVQLLITKCKRALKGFLLFCLLYFVLFSTPVNALSTSVGTVPNIYTNISHREKYNSTKDLFENFKNIKGERVWSLREVLAGYTDLGEEDKRDPYVEGEVIVKYKKDQIDLGNNRSGNETAFLERQNLERIDNIANKNIVVLKIKDSKKVEEKIKELEKLSEVEYVQPNYRYYPSSINTNDPYKNDLWGLYNYGQTVNEISGSVDSDIDAPEAWNINEGTNSTVIVAVIDTGVAYGHPDLASNMWDGSNCVDYMGGALSGCNHGYDYEGNDKSPLPEDYDKLYSHGTHIAGTIAGAKNNNEGVVGVASKSKIMALKTNLTTLQLVKAIEFAGKNGAKIINASWGTYGTNSNLYDISLYNAINDFSGLFIVAVGNEGYNSDDGISTHKLYPSGFRVATSIGPGLENIISVAATDQNDSLASFSNYGVSSVDVGAPGTNVKSTVTYKEELNETYIDVPVLTTPINWTKWGDNNSWGVRGLLDIDGNIIQKFLYGDTYKPYNPNSNTFVSSPTYNLNTIDARVNFEMLCDTPYSSSTWTDYMYYTLSGDNGFTWSGSDRWDEYVLDNLSGSYRPTGFSHYVHYPYASIDLEEQYLTNRFKLAFGWISDSHNNDYWGCAIGNLQIIKSDYNYDYSQGTSMATPHVAGLAALIWGYQPSLTINEVKSAILDNGDLVSSLEGKTVTGKRINAYKSLSALTNVNSVDIYPNTQQTITTDQSIQFSPFTLDINGSQIYREGFIWGGTNNFGLFSTDTPGEYGVNFSYDGFESDLINIIVRPPFNAENIYVGNYGTWNVSATKFMVAGDFNGDGKEEMGAMYDYGGGKMGIFSFEWNDEGLSPRSIYKGNYGTWNVSATKFMVAGDFNGDGIDDIGAMYDYGGGKMGIFSFEWNGEKLVPRPIYKGNYGAWNVSATKFMVASDFNGDNLEDIGAMYNYGDGKMGLWSFEWNGEKLVPNTVYKGNYGTWNVSATKFMVAGDFNGDGIDDMGAMYDYGGGKMGIFSFEWNGEGLSPRSIYKGNYGAWNVSATKFMVAGDLNADGQDDIGIMYDYGKSKMGLWSFEWNGEQLVPKSIYKGVEGSWSVSSTKFMVSGDFNNDTYGNVGVMYDYGGGKMGLWYW